MLYEPYLTPSPSSVKFRSKRRSNITSSTSLNQQTSSNSTSSRTMGVVDHEDQSSRNDSAACEPPQGCDKDSLWWALVNVASQRYDEMMAEEAQQNREQVAEPVTQVIQNNDDEEDGDERLVIDEAPSDDHQEQPEPASTATDNSDNYEVSVRYNANMARKFPGAENRTPEQQAVRQRNTVAARQSRAKMRIMEDMLNQEAYDERRMNTYMKERIGVSCMYGNALREFLDLDEADFWAEFEKVKDQYIVEPIRSQHVVPRNISDESYSYSDDEEDECEEEEEEQQPGTSADTVGNRMG